MVKELHWPTVSFTFCHFLFDGESNSPIFGHSRRTAQVLLVALRVQSDNAVTWRKSTDLCPFVLIGLFSHFVQGCWKLPVMIWHIFLENMILCHVFFPAISNKSKSAINVLVYILAWKANIRISVSPSTVGTPTAPPRKAKAPPARYCLDTCHEETTHHIYNV